MMAGLSTVLLLLVVSVQPSQAVEMVCVEGFVMDRYCIDLGVLLDNRAVKTLENPEKHSVHCLVDVPLCFNSGYNMLLPNPSGSPRFAYAITLDSYGSDKVLEVARREGASCSTCNGGGKIVRGFRATVTGELVRSTDKNKPSLLKVSNLTASPKNFNSTTTLDGCPGGATANLNLTLITSSGGFKKPSIAHGSLMIIGWGFLLPTGISSARFLKHRPNALWFKAHRIVQITGLIIAITGWIVALATFDVFNGKGDSYNHGAMGMTVMVLGILQPVNAFFRPHPPKEGEKRPLKRLLWEILHKSVGYITALLATGTILYGTYVIAVHQTVFRAAWGVSLGWIFFFTAACIYDGCRYSKLNRGHSMPMN